MKTIVKIACLLCALVLFPVLCHAAQTVSQNAVPNSAKAVSGQSVISVAVPTPALPAPLTEEGILRESQRQFDRSMTIMGYVIELLGLVLAGFAACFVYFEYKGYSARKELEKLIADAKTGCDAVKNNKEITDGLREQIRSNLVSLDKITPDMKLKVEDMTKRLDFLEMMGVTPRPQDYIIRAAELYANGKYEESLAYLDKLLAINPNDYTALISRGNALLKLNKYEDALDACERAIELKPTDTTAWFNKGVILGECGRHEEALRAYDKVIELEPRDMGALNNRGVTFLEFHKYEEAIAAFNQAVNLGPKRADSYFNLACAYALSGKRDQALSDLREAVRLDGTYKQKAKKDEDFKALWDDEDFKKIVNS